MQDTTVAGVRNASDSSRRFFGQAVPQSLTEDELISFWADNQIATDRGWQLPIR